MVFQKPTYEELAQRVQELEKAESERNRAEQLLRESEEHLSSIFRSAPIGIGSVVNRELKKVNFRLCEITGYNEEELVGQNSRILYPSIEDFEFVGREKYAQIGDHGIGTVETHWQRKDGTIIDILLSSTPVDMQDHSKGVTFTALDITERKWAETALRQSNDKMESVLASMMDGLLILDKNWRFSYFNQQGAGIIGMKNDELLGQCVWDLFPHSKDTKFHEAYHRAVDSGRAVHFEEFYPEPLNQWLECHCYPSEEGLSVYFRDITERKRAEEQKRQLHETVAQEKDRLSALVNSITDEIWFADTEGKFQLVNPSGNREFNLNTAGAIDVRELASSLEVLRTDGSPRPIEEAPPLRALRGEIVRNQEELIRTPATSGLRWRQVSSSPVRNTAGHVIGSVSVVCDITERKQAEEALRQSEGQFSVLIQNLQSAVALVNERGEFTIVNQSFLRIFELNKDSSIKNVNDRDWSQWRVFDEHSMLLDMDKHPVRKAALTCRPVRDQLIAVKAPTNPNIKWLLVSAEPILDSQGHIYRLICTYHDITERKRDEEQIKAALAEKEVLLKEIHHRVKNNLQVISSLISLQSDNLTDNRMLDEFNDIRDRVRSMALVHEKLYQTSDLAQLNFADYAASLLHSLWRSHGTLAEKVRFNSVLAPVKLSIEAAVPCGLILNELAGNALKHAFPNGSDGEVTVALEYNAPTDAICLRVHDNGVGLPAGLDWQQSKSLGLRLVRILAGQLRGTIETETGTGTEFRVTFPLRGFRS